MINFQDKDGRSISCFHIPKCGGMSILYGIFGAGLADPGKGKFFQHNRRLRFGAYHYNDGHGEFADHFPYAVAQERGFTVHAYSIAIVRNPWHRCVSRFVYLKDIEQRLPSDLSFSDWLMKKPLASDKSLWRAGGWHQQYEYLTDQQGNLAVSKIYKLEETDIFALFSDLLARPLRPQLINASPSYDYRSFYDTKLVNEVARTYAKDIATFGYRFE